MVQSNPDANKHSDGPNKKKNALGNNKRSCEVHHVLRVCVHIVECTTRQPKQLATEYSAMW